MYSIQLSSHPHQITFSLLSKLARIYYFSEGVMGSFDYFLFFCLSLMNSS